jgi:hypothetical protein
MKEQLRTSIRHWLQDPEKLAWFVYGMIAAFVVIGIVSGLVASTGRSIIPPLLTVQPTIITLGNEVCPGGEVVQDVQLRSRQPTVVEISSAIFSVADRRIILGTERRIDSPVPADLDQLPLPMRFTAPDVPPGKYRAVFAIIPKGRASEIAFVDIGFAIGDC